MKIVVDGQVIDAPQQQRPWTKMVNGQLVQMTQAEIDERLAEETIWDAGLPRLRLIEQIHELEMLETPRRISEAILGLDNGWLANNRAQIAAMREQLSPIQ